MRNWIVYVVVVASVSVLALTPPVEAASRSRSPVIWLDDASEVERAFSVLIRNDDGVAMRISSRQLPRGAYTLWWVIWDLPENCAVPFECGEADLGNLDAGFALQFATGQILTKRMLSAAGGLSKGAPTLVGDGFDNPNTAEIHWVVQYHGPVSPDEVHLQIQSPPGLGCNPDCVDLQGSIHRAP